MLEKIELTIKQQIKTMEATTKLLEKMIEGNNKVQESLETMNLMEDHLKELFQMIIRNQTIIIQELIRFKRGVS